MRLTEEERKFAEQNHNLIYTLLGQFHFPIEEYYGEAAYGYLQAVIKYHRQPNLRKYCFSTIARRSVLCYCVNEIDSRKRYAGHIAYSMNEPIDAEGTERGEFLRDIQNPFKELEEQEEMKRLRGEIRQRLSSSQKRQFDYLLQGYKPREIRHKLKKGYNTYKADMEIIQKVVLRSCTGATG